MTVSRRITPMKIAVCVKQVPDTWAEKTLQASDSTLDRDAADGVMNELDEYAVEEALKLAEAQGGEVVVVTMGPERAGETVRKALSMGADAGVHLVDAGLHGSDALATSYALAELLKGRGFDLVIFGSESTDARMSVVPAMVAERLGVAQLTFAQKVDVEGGTVTIQRATETGYDTVEAAMPAVISVPGSTHRSSACRPRGRRSRTSRPGRRRRRAPSSRTRVTAESRSPRSCPSRSSSESWRSNIRLSPSIPSRRRGKSRHG
jgi:electron transfer flavoprotein alpha/beta subunit